MLPDYIDVGDGLVISEDGEIVESAGINDPLAFIARKRHEAHIQEKDWHDYKATLDAVLKRKQDERRTAYGDYVITVMSGDYRKFHADKFAAGLDGTEFTREELVSLVLAATGFDRDLLPTVAVSAYDEAVEVKGKAPWVLSSIARKLAPKATKQLEEAAV